MSYCRFSANDYQCDVYVYADVSGGWTTHVAGNRQTGIGPAPAGVGNWWARGDMGVRDFMDREEAVKAWLATGERTEIGLPHDGGHFNDATAEECADRLEELRGLGYNVPQSAIDALREESAEDE